LRARTGAILYHDNPFLSHALDSITVRRKAELGAEDAQQTPFLKNKFILFFLILFTPSQGAGKQNSEQKGHSKSVF
jgi:hypothetical protein